MSVIRVVWEPPTTTSTSAVKQPTSPSHPQQTQPHTHHFHFPPKSLLAATASFNEHLKSQGRKLSHIADGERGPAGRGSVSSLSPPTDIRQTKLAYHIEIEVPGTTDKDALLIQWLSPSTLLVRGEIERPFVGHGKAAEGTYLWQQGEENGDGYPVGDTQNQEAQATNENEQVSNGYTYQSSTGSKHLEGQTADDGGKVKKMVTDSGDECADIPMFLLEERHTGPWQRTFALPHDVEMKALKAKLEGGLLRIDIPIRDVNDKPGMKIEIE